MLVLVMLFGSAFTVSAAEVNAEQASLDNVIAQIRAQHPNAEIIVEDGVISVIVKQTEELTMSLNQSVDQRSTAELMATETTYYAPDGGTWSGFSPPWYYLLNPTYTRPWSVVYIPHDEAEAIYEVLVDRSVFEYILEQANLNVPYNQICDMLDELFGIGLEYHQVAFLIAKVTLAMFDSFNRAGFRHAYETSSEHKVRVDFCTADGWSVNYYYAWEGNYVTNDPWQDFNPTFNRGVINF